MSTGWSKKDDGGIATLGPSPLRRRSGANDGFTLIELLVVVIIIGILAAIAIPVFLGQRSKAAGAQAKSDLRNIATAEFAYFSDYDNYLDTAAPDSAFDRFHTSNHVVTLVVETLNTDGSKSGSNGTGGFCATATTSNGGTYYYSSMLGGLTDTQCP